MSPAAASAPHSGAASGAADLPALPSLREVAARIGARLVLVHRRSDPEAVLAAIEAAVMRDPWDRALRFVVRMEDFSGSLDAARAFGEACDRALRKLRAANPYLDFKLEGALAFLAEMRRHSAEGARSRTAGEFGRPRCEAPDELSPRTPLLSHSLARGETVACRYTPYLPRAVAMLASTDEPCHVMWGDTGAGAVALTTTRWARSPFRHDLEWAHPSSDGFAPMLARCDQIFREALRAPRREVLGRVAELHWWLAHINRYRRGSASIADMVCKLVLDARGVAVAAWRPGVAPDIEAYVTPLAAYRVAYPTLFERAPENAG